MAITQNTDRIRIESFAKNDTLGTQGVLNANQIKFNTNISTNNSDLEASPTFDDRHIILRRGETDEEINLITSVNVDGVTCTCLNDWDSAPVSGDTYDVLYIPEDVATIAGCDFETDSRQWNLTKRLIIGITTTTAGGLGLSRGRIMRMDDRGAAQTALQVNTLGWIIMGIYKELPSGESRAERGGQLIFTNDASNETVMDIDGHAFMYEFAMHSARAPDGVIGLKVTHDAGATVKWSRFQGTGMDTPYKKKQRKFHDVPGVYWGTVKEMKDNMASLGGWCTGDADESVLDTINLEADDKKVYLVVEDA